MVVFLAFDNEVKRWALCQWEHESESSIYKHCGEKSAKQKDPSHSRVLEKITLFYLSNCSSYTVPTAGICLDLAIVCSREAILQCVINYTFNQYTYFSFFLLSQIIDQAFSPEDLYLLKDLKIFKNVLIPPYIISFSFFFFGLYLLWKYFGFFFWLFSSPNFYIIVSFPL